MIIPPYTIANYWYTEYRVQKSTQKLMIYYVCSIGSKVFVTRKTFHLGKSIPWKGAQKSWCYIPRSCIQFSGKTFWLEMFRLSFHRVSTRALLQPVWENINIVFKSFLVQSLTVGVLLTVNKMAPYFGGKRSLNRSLTC